MKSHMGRLESDCIVDNLMYFESISSTNDFIKEYIREREDNPFTDEYSLSRKIGTILVVADEQTAGRGRMGRAWSSPPGTGIWMSLLCHPKLHPESLSSVTLLSALAITDALQTMLSEESESDTLTTVDATHMPKDTDFGIKWPNDVVIGGRKISGILTEQIGTHTICGIGINVTTTDFPEELRDRATSVLLETGKVINRGNFIYEIIRNLTEYIHLLEKDGDMRYLAARYNDRLVHMNKEVVLSSSATPDSASSQEPVCRQPHTSDITSHTNQEIYICRGISPSGALLAEDSSGTVHEIISGEISVRGIYGYV